MSGEKNEKGKQLCLIAATLGAEIHRSELMNIGKAGVCVIAFD